MDDFLALAIQNYAQAELAQAQRNFLANAQCVPADGAPPPMQQPVREAADATPVLVQDALEALGTRYAQQHALGGLLRALRNVPGVGDSVAAALAEGQETQLIANACDATRDAYFCAAEALLSVLIAPEKARLQ
ncbi:MAG TPA: hypothetical protein VF453_09500 [Burkholderiaceae bacterium]